MEKREIIDGIMALSLAEQREIFEMLRERLCEAGEGGGATVQKAPEKKRSDPWGSVYSELAKTFRRPAPRGLGAVAAETFITNWRLNLD